MKIYVDTSFLVSLYSPDANSAAAAGVMQASKGQHLVSTLGELEVVNALQLRVFRKELSPAQARAALVAFESDLQSHVFQLVALPEHAFDRARQLSLRTTAKLGTRTADLLHIAPAMELGAEVLYSFDLQQRKLAQTLQLKLN
ncbi:MAG: type II toxin-antitoxin system VapC family toxin [Acidobacteriia bacterium]|nr:type II toxin-antitoxin system VapC family toxin [Terriglobia bacterium]